MPHHHQQQQPSEYEEELDMICSMYSDEIRIVNTCSGQNEGSSSSNTGTDNTKAGPVSSTGPNSSSSRTTAAAVFDVLLPAGFVAQVTVPRCGYPCGTCSTTTVDVSGGGVGSPLGVAVFPEVELIEGPNAVIIGTLEQMLRRKFAVAAAAVAVAADTHEGELISSNELLTPNSTETATTATTTTGGALEDDSFIEFLPGAPCFISLINWLQHMTQKVAERLAEEEQRRSEEEAAWEEEQQHHQPSSPDADPATAAVVFGHKLSHPNGIKIYAGGNVIVDRKSKFLAHVAAVQSPAEVVEVLAEIRANRHIAASTHPAIYAYRFTDKSDRLHSDYDDDGEHGAAKKILFLLESLKVDGYIVVVTRWYGGTLLGPDRFKHICTVAKSCLEEAGAVG